MKRLSFLILFFLFTASGCSDKKAEENLETATSGTMEFIADEELRPAIDSMVKGFMLENPRTKVTVRYASAGKALEELLNENTRFVVVSRGLTQLEQELLKKYNLSLPEYDMAQNAVAVIVSANNPLSALSMRDLKSLVRNEFKDWSDLKYSEFEGGRPPGVLTKVLPPFYSSTEHLLDSLFLDPNVYQQGSIRRFEASDSIISYVSQNEHTLGFIGSSWLDRLQKSGDLTVKAIPLLLDDTSRQTADQPIMLHLAYVHQGLYPLTSRVNGYTFDVPNTLPRGFLAYAMTAHGQTVFKNHNILPRTQIIRVVPNR
jgi:phosphate transport system substrate-binding protein